MLLLFCYKKGRSITYTYCDEITPCNQQGHDHENGSKRYTDDRANLFHKNTLIVINTTFCVFKWSKTKGDSPKIGRFPVHFQAYMTIFASHL